MSRMTGKPPRYRFEMVKRALRQHWGLDLRRGGEMKDGDPRHNGRWAAEYSKTGFVVSGELPRRGFGYARYASLARVVRYYELAKVIRTLVPLAERDTTDGHVQPILGSTRSGARDLGRPDGSRGARVGDPPRDRADPGVVGAAQGSQVTAPDWYNLLAAKRGAPAGWRWFELRAVDNGSEGGAILIRGVVCTTMYKSGPAKGLPNWTKADNSTEQLHVTTDAELEQLRAAWEIETGKCQACGGTGQRTVSISIDGTRTQMCKRCRGSGEASPIDCMAPSISSGSPAADGTF